MIVGITGLTGSGKSYITNLIQDYYKTYTDVYVFDCDKIYHNLIKPNQPCWQELKETFSDEIIDSETNEIDRKILASIVFSDETKITILNYITWKYVTNELNKTIENLDSRDICIVDCPLLFPSNLDKICDKIIITEASLTKRVARLVSRDKITLEQAFKRINSQPNIDQIGENILRIDTDNGISDNNINIVIKFIGE